LLIGSDTTAATATLQHVASEILTVEAGDFRAARSAAALGELLDDESIVVLPASPDGRDLAPRLAAQLQRPLHAMALSGATARIDLIRQHGTELHSFNPPSAFVATLQPGVRGVDHI